MRSAVRRSNCTSSPDTMTCQTTPANTTTEAADAHNRARRTVDGVSAMADPVSQTGLRPRSHGRSAVEDLSGGALARADRAVDRAVRHGGGLGAGPVHPTERLAQQVPVAREEPGRQMREGATTRPVLVLPRRFHE